MKNEILKKKILRKVVSLRKFGLNDLTWKKEDAKELIISLMEDDIGILGGSVYKIDKKRLIALYDNWSCSWNNSEESEEIFFLRSKKIAFDYINRYLIYPEEQILFSLVFTGDMDVFEQENS